MREGTFTAVITDIGLWYSLTVNHKGYILEFRDSLKLLPFSVNLLHSAFETKHEKLHIEYKGNMHAYGEITPEQRAYIENDVYVVKEAFEKFLTEIGSTKIPPLTISQWALSEFKKSFTNKEWDNLFPNLTEVPLDPDKFGSSNADEYIRRSYLGGWCYVDETKTGKINNTTYVYDVNSLYSSVMRDHKNGMPIGLPSFIKKQEDFLKFPKDCYYFIRFRCQFVLREGYLPFLQLKHDFNYRSNENLVMSRYDRRGMSLGNYKPTITLSKTMFELFNQCYKITDFEFLDAAIFNTEYGLFDQYIDKFIALKIKAGEEGNKVKRTIAKLALNSLYGRFGRNPENSFKLPSFNEDSDEVEYFFETGPDNKPLYIPIASAITSYARKFTLRAAILNSEYFYYSDTDSLHMCHQDNYTPKGMVIDESHLSCWKLENVAQHSLFIRQKTYIEFTGSDYDIKACGMPDRSKMLFEENLRQNKPVNGVLRVRDEKIILTPSEVEFMRQKRTVDDFKIGFSVPGKLMPKIIKGGTVLTEVEFTIN